MTLTTMMMRRLCAGLAILFFSAAADAQVLDRIDVTVGERSADVTIRFSSRIHYLRHGPQGNVLETRVFLRLTDPAILESELLQETMRSPVTDRVPRVTVVFPELRNGMFVTFSQRTNYTLKPGADGQSIVLTVPLLPPSRKAASPAPSGAAVLPLPAVVPGSPALPAAAAPKAAAGAASAAAPATSLPAAPRAAAATGEAAAAAGPEAAAGATTEATEAEAAAEAVPYQPERTPAETEALARGYLDEAQQAMAAGDLPLAINRLNRILGLPATAQTEPAQALIGEAREANRELFKAKAEYEIYLKLFPTGKHVARVKERLAVLNKDAAAVAAVKPAAKEAAPTEWTISGSLSTNYYFGKSQIETLIAPPPGELTFNKQTLSLTDQRSLITSLNFNARRRNAETDTRIVFRDTDNRNFLSPDRSYNRFYTASVEHTDRKNGYYVKAGRQNPNGMGVLDRFDGLQGGVNLGTDWRANAVAGQAIDFVSTLDKTFYGTSLDFLPLSGRPGASLYAIDQTLDKLSDRRAVGAELRFFDGHVNAYGMIDYDVLYKGVNIALLQGNYLDDGGNNYFAVYDHRRTPPLSLINASNLVFGVSLQDLVAAQGIDTVRHQARALTAWSDLFSIGLTHPVTTNWQLGADYRWSSISANREVATVLPLTVIGICPSDAVVDSTNDTCTIHTQAQPGSGASHAVTLQSIGNNFLLPNATVVGSLSLIFAPTYRGQAYGLSYALPLGERWRLDSNLRYYTQRDDGGGTQSRVSPSLKVAFQWRNSLYLEVEVGAESSHTVTADVDDHSDRQYGFAGIRWDFR